MSYPVVRLPVTVLGPEAAVAALVAGQREVFCLLPDDYYELSRRKIAWIYITRALHRAGAQGSIWWAWYREDEDGEPETVFRITSR